MPKTIGYDYGIKPSFMVVGDVGFPELLPEGWLALGYGTVPQFGLLVSPPFLGMVFKNEDIARESFRHFHGWCEENPSDGDAVGISVIRYLDGDFGLCIYQEFERLISRLVPEQERSEFEPIVLAGSHLKRFDKKSEGIDWFEHAVRDRMWLLVPALPDGRLLLDLALRKRQIDFFSSDKIPKNHQASIFRNVGGHRTKTRPRRPSLRKQKPSEIHHRRSMQLSRFFPVTLERLTFDEHFQQLNARLASKGYAGWQIEQAACNLVLKGQEPHLFARLTGKKGEAPPNPLEFLLHNVESLDAPKPADLSLTEAALRNQIHADACALLEYFGAATVCKKRPTRVRILSELRDRGLLME